jgi:hypothetical protein
MDSAVEDGNSDALGCPLRRLLWLSPDGVIASRRMICDWRDRYGLPRALRKAPA